MPNRQPFTGGTYTSSCVRHWRRLSPAAAAGAWTGFASLAEGACDALRVDTDNTIVYAHPPSRPVMIDGSSTAWTAGAGWTITSGVAVHAAAGGTANLSLDTATSNPNDPLIVNQYYAVVFTIAGRTAGTVTPKIGTTAGTARSTSGTYIEIIQAQSTSLIFTPTTDFDGSITLSSVWCFSGTPPLAAGIWDPTSAIKVVCTAASSAPGTITTAGVWGGWLFRPSNLDGSCSIDDLR